jgi:hypothetical protein
MADVDSPTVDSTSTGTAAVTTSISPTQAFANDSNSQHLHQQQPQVQLQQPLPLTATATATLLDVQQLDDYLLRLVLAKLQQVVHLYHGSGESTNNTADASIASSKASWLWPALQLVTLWVTQGQTPAVRLLGLRVDVDAASDGASSSTSSPARNANTRIGLLRYSVLGILVPYLYQKLKDWKTSVEVQEREQQEDGSHPTLTQHQLSRQRRFQVARMLIKAVDTMLPGVKLALLFTCWSSTGTGEHVPPNNIAARLCQWKYHTAQSQTGQQSHQQSRLHVDFAHRRWLYDCLMQTSRIWWAGLFLLPPVWGQDVQDYMVSPVTRVVRDLSSKVADVAASASALVFSPKTVHTVGNQQQQKSLLSCPICRRTDTDPVTVPVQGSCAATCRQIYCYACLYAAAVRSRSRSNSKVYCRTCREIITSCKFVDVQAVEAHGD